MLNITYLMNIKCWLFLNYINYKIAIIIFRKKNICKYKIN